MTIYYISYIIILERKWWLRLLKDTLKKSGITQFEIKDLLGIKSLSTVNLKLNGKAKLTLDEAVAIRDLIYDRTKKKYKLEDFLI